ncbi:MAG: hypothetical protein ABIO70_25000, partial [Pseudomonadota bacterium]
GGWAPPAGPASSALGSAGALSARSDPVLGRRPGGGQEPLVARALAVGRGAPREIGSAVPLAAPQPRPDGATSRWTGRREGSPQAPQQRQPAGPWAPATTALVPSRASPPPIAPKQGARRSEGRGAKPAQAPERPRKGLRVTATTASRPLPPRTGRAEDAFPPTPEGFGAEPVLSWRAPVARRGAGRAAQAPPSQAERVPREATERELLSILQSLSTGSPEGRKLLTEVARRISELRRVDALRKIT